MTQEEGNILCIRGQHTLPFAAKKVLDLITDCLKKKIEIDNSVLQNWYLEEVVKPRRKSVRVYMKGEDGTYAYQRIDQYEYLQSCMKDGELGYWHLTEPKRLLKYHIGGLVVRGYLKIFPNFKIDFTETDLIEPAKTNKQ